MPNDSEVMKANANSHTHNSAYREKLIEHLFVGELLKLSWLHHGCCLEISKPEVDNAGYDLIAETPGFVRHIQLKTMKTDGTAASQKVHTKLAEKPSGCVVWIFFDANTMSLGPFRYFGSEAGKPLPSLTGYKIAKHTKGNKEGFRAERPHIRVIPKGDFDKFETVEEIFARLFHVDLRITEKIPALSSSLKSPKNANEVLPIDLTPADPEVFKRDFLRSRRATIKITYSDGAVEVKEWRGDRFSKSSNVIGNLRTRTNFRNGKWQANGILHVSVQVEPTTH